MRDALRPKSLETHLFGEGRKRILALDGGGVRGILTCGILEQVEAKLASRLPAAQREDFRLCHYFDLIAGTSTGAIMATLLALGYKVSEIKALYRTLANDVFGTKKHGIIGMVPKFDSKRLTKVINDCFRDFLISKGADPNHCLELGTDYLQTGLMICSKRIDKGSPWILTNNPKAKYWEWNSPHWQGYYNANGGPGEKFIANKHYILQQVVQASASAPFFLSPVEKQISPEEKALFFDGGVSPHNNPAMQAFLVATMKWRDNAKPWPTWKGEPKSPFGFGWKTGADNISVLSLGTGAFRPTFNVSDFKGKMAGLKAIEALRGMIPDTSTNGLTWLQAMSDPAFPIKINSELGDMDDLGIMNDSLLHFQRIDVDLDEPAIRDILGDDLFDGNDFLGDFPKKGVDEMIKTMRALENSTKTNMDRLETIGEHVGQYWFGMDRHGRRPIPSRGDLNADPASLILPHNFDS